MKQKIRKIISELMELPGGIDRLTDRDDLYDAGMTSFDSVQLMLALEESFEIEFPERLLNRRVFSSVSSIADAVGELLSENAIA